MKKNFQVKPLIPFALIFILTCVAYLFAFFKPLTWEDLKVFHLSLKNFSESHTHLMPFLFMGTYILYALSALPGIFMLSLVAGFLFTQPFSTMYVIISATTGASLLYLSAKSALGQLFLRRNNKGIFAKLEQGFRKNAISYLLFLRLVPLFPFWVVNIAGAVFEVPYRTFLWTTLLGMIPSVFIYTQAGRSLTLFFEEPDILQPISFFHKNFIFALLGLALLSLVPIFIKRFRPNLPP